MESKNIIENIHWCKSCPYYITEKDKHVILGKGDITSKTIILLKRYSDNLSEQIYRVLEDLYKKEFNRKLTEDYYITYLPKCHNYNINRFTETEQLVSSCINLLVRELDCYCHYYNKIIVFDTILSDVLQQFDFHGTNLTMLYSITPRNSDTFINEFKNIIKNDKYMGL